MSSKIVILNGSPRRNGNTSALVQAFREGAENTGHNVTEFFLDKMNIHG
ncbi:MAG: NAD(P)H-dependent oxidoreductase, partial [Lachnospiraceae bacterium]|nr:NAD(P)H-dependent oxidoreductase [Lachnospiraceae bacterium]